MILKLSGDTGYTPYQLFWEVPQEEVETLLVAKARKDEDAFKTMTAACTMAIGFAMGGKKANKSFERFMRKSAIPSRRKVTEKQMLDDMERYKVNIPEK